MRVAIVCGHFMPEAGYYEVHISEALAKQGHQVRVFTSNRSNLRLKQEKTYTSGQVEEIKPNLEVYRFQTLFRIGATIFSKGLFAKVKDYQPDIVLAIGIAKLFPVPVLKSKEKREYALYSIFGENSEYYTWHNVKAIIKNAIKIVTRKLLKQPFYRRAIRNSDKVFLYTPETFDFLADLVGKRFEKNLQSKAIVTSLGFDDSIFYFDNTERSIIRAENRIDSHEFLLLTVTRYSKSKSIEFLIDKVVEFRKLGHPVKYWLIGFNNDWSINYINDYIRSKSAEEFIFCFPFMTYDKLRGYQAAADMGIWCQVTISIQQSMGTGLPVLLEEKSSVSHLIHPNFNGYYFNKGNILEVLGQSIQSFGPKDKTVNDKLRKEIEVSNRSKFSYRGLVQHIISS